MTNEQRATETFWGALPTAPAEASPSDLMENPAPVVSRRQRRADSQDEVNTPERKPVAWKTLVIALVATVALAGGGFAGAFAITKEVVYEPAPMVTEIPKSLVGIVPDGT